ncbi:MAG: hypothetical protein HDT19_04495 [Oscillibacter sp.]|nr:hypothetical protein [Oscillibacter sp.]
MDGPRLFWRLLCLTLRRFLRRIVPLAGLAALCAALPWLAGAGAEAALSQGSGFTGLSLVITSPEGEAVPESLAGYLAAMPEVGQYCQISAMEYGEALTALDEGRAAAVLALPGDFIPTVQRGEAAEVRLLVDSRRPLEGALALWVGQSAADLLAAVQTGVYTVLDAYDSTPPPGLDRDRAVMEINLQYVQWVLRRQGLFRQEVLSPTGVLPIAPHYQLSLLWFLVLSLAPLFAWNFQGEWLTCQRRLRWAGQSPLWGYGASLTVCGLGAAAAVFPVLSLWAGGISGHAAWAALLGGIFFAAWAALCGTAGKTAAGCGGLSLLLSLGALVLSGGVVPPALLPQAVRRLTALSPITWLRSASAASMGYPAEGDGLFILTAAVLLGCTAAVLYKRRVREQEGKV